MTTTALDVPTWSGPPWAEYQAEQTSGIRWVRPATTVVTEAPAPELLDHALH